MGLVVGFHMTSLEIGIKRRGGVQQVMEESGD
jgi:hypothetical protein